ncbi:hypothetical protein AAFN87_07215 [Solibacillus sp. CAU 1738]
MTTKIIPIKKIKSSPLVNLSYLKIEKKNTNSLKAINGFTFGLQNINSQFKSNNNHKISAE